MYKLILVTGGARSGKSHYAQKRAEEMRGSKCFLATCPPIDLEMDQRISKHKIDRQDKGWHTVEEQLHIDVVLKRKKYDVFLIDCLTLWINNILYHCEIKKKVCNELQIIARCQKLIQTVASCDAHVIMVTNEVGMSIVPENGSGRLYRDLIGRCNQIMAEAADEVVLVCCGIPLQIK